MRCYSIFPLFVILVGPTAQAQEAPENTAANSDDALDELFVYGRALSQIGTSQSASEGLVGYDDIQQVPIARVGELVEAVPGMVATQHSGTGKANQYFIRGFNLDHGTDFSVSVEGVPINMRTHGHGQGYLDLSFLIPELVETTSFRRGPYSAQVGDFSSAASMDFDLYNRLPEKILAVSAGEDGYLRGLAGGSFDIGDGSFTGAVDATRYDGPWDLPEDLTQNKLHAAYNFELGKARINLLAQGYDASWDSTDQIPARAVQSGIISDLGFIDPDLGGESSRYALTGSADFGTWQLNAYVVDYELSLFSNFTYLLDDPVNGDEFEQRDDRRIYGASIVAGNERAFGKRNFFFRWGGDVRIDDIDEVALFNTSNRQRINTVRQDMVEQRSLAAFGEVETHFDDRLRLILGLRADYYDWDVSAVRSANSGNGNDTLVSPTLSLAYRINDGLETYVNWGQSFHSNDVRGATITVDPDSGEPVDSIPVLVQSSGAEVGLRMEQGQGFNATLVAFWLELDSELVYVGDAGTVEPNDATERVGFEATLFWQANEWLAANAAYTVTDSNFKTDQGGGTRIPGAVESTFTLGLNAAWKNGLRASARLRWLDEAPLVEDNSVRSGTSTLVNAGVAYRRGITEYRLDVFNLFDSNDDDIAYFYASRLAGEPVAGIEDIHYHPLEPRTVRASVTLHWE